ncbi:hydrolase [Pseudomaricurvus alkylphenolicus]|uniref:hydrolase n=1 Tax=Pseudomaricurvus alkylphenolicus TaxID=1306991 RepID=UPI0014231D89|nr:hydrolase [Pseudomaricurvus alkylphenolicus]NIB41388.1 hydrolase [Pseudomaricurvus alkylphenolicus]
MQKNITNQELELLQQIDSRLSFMLDTTVALCDLNSGSYHKAGIEAVQTRFQSLFNGISDSYEERELAPIKCIDDKGGISWYQPAPMQIFRARPQAPLQILCTGHSDTVFPQGSSFDHCWTEDNRLRGPGTADMKGGLVALHECLRALHHSPYRDRFGFTLAISPDEEIGSPSSAPILAELAQSADFGLTFEPALADGTLAGARKGSGNFVLTAKGHSTHAGRDYFSGRNAVVAIAEAAVRLSRLSDEQSGITVNIGAIEGGGPVNIVPDNCVCRFNVRVSEPEQQQQMLQAIDAIKMDVAQHSGTELELHGHFNRPPKPMTAEQQEMFELLQRCGQRLGTDVQWRATGGCCEGNNLAAAGLLNIDTLGVRGANIHSHDEYACIDSFVERAQLSALFITQLIEFKQQDCTVQSSTEQGA